MDTDPLWSMLSTGGLPLLLSAAALGLAVIALFIGSGARRRSEDQLTALRERSDTLWREVDDIRVAQFNRPGESGNGASGSPVEEARYQKEVEAYARIWPQVWNLHERLGMFLRAVEGGEAAGEAAFGRTHAPASSGVGSGPYFFTMALRSCSSLPLYLARSAPTPATLEGSYLP